MIDVIRHNVEKYCKQLPVIATEGMLRSRSDDWGWFVTRNYLLPFYIDKKFIFRRLVFTSEPLKREDSLTLDDEKAFLNEVVDYCKTHLKIDFIAKAQITAVFQSFPDDADIVPWGTMVVDLTKSEEELFNGFERKCRNIIRRSIKLGTTVEETDDLDLVYETVRNTLKRQKNSNLAPRSFFINLKKNLNNNIKYYIAKNNGKMQGVGVILFDNNKGYAYYAGSSERPVPGSINLMHYEIMKDLMKKGIKEYDFVGVRTNVQQDTKHAAIRRFKERFNPKLIEGYAFRVIIKPFKFALYNVAVKLYFASKGHKYSDPFEQIKHTSY